MREVYRCGPGFISSLGGGPLGGGTGDDERTCEPQGCQTTQSCGAVRAHRHGDRMIRSHWNSHHAPVHRSIAGMVWEGLCGSSLRVRFRPKDMLNRMLPLSEILERPLSPTQAPPFRHGSGRAEPWVEPFEQAARKANQLDSGRSSEDSLSSTMT